MSLHPSNPKFLGCKPVAITNLSAVTVFPSTEIVLWSINSGDWWYKVIFKSSSFSSVTAGTASVKLHL